jgi:hypothetical protein
MNNQLIQNLPTDVINHIIPYTYTLQPKSLLNDLTNFIIAKQTLSEIYYHLYTIHYEEDEREYKYWLINDLFAFANDYNATMYGYVDKFYKIFYRNQFLKTKIDIDRYIVNLEENVAVESQINLFLGLLLPDERNNVVNRISH